MLSHHRKVLEVLAEAGDEYPYFSFGSLSRRTGMERREVRRITRHLARKGFTEYGKGLWTDDGELAGSGYRITDAGRFALTSGQGNP